MSVSIIIPVAEPHIKYLPEALASIQLPEAEVIIVNDSGVELEGATINTPKLGAGAARNRGVDVATHALICFLDADDYFVPGGLEALYHAVDPTCDAIIYGDALVEDNRPYNLRDVVNRAGKFTANPLHHQFMAVTSLIPKGWHYEVGGFDEKMRSLEDHDYEIRHLVLHGHCAIHIHQPVLYYRVYSSIRRIDKPARDEAKAIMANRYREYFIGRKRLVACNSGCGGGQRAVPAPRVFDSDVPVEGADYYIEFVGGGGGASLRTYQGVSGRSYRFGNSEGNRRKPIGENYQDGYVPMHDAQSLLEKRVRNGQLFRIVRAI